MYITRYQPPFFLRHPFYLPSNTRRFSRRILGLWVLLVATKPFDTCNASRSHQQQGSPACIRTWTSTVRTSIHGSNLLHWRSEMIILRLSTVSWSTTRTASSTLSWHSMPQSMLSRAFGIAFIFVWLTCFGQLTRQEQCCSWPCLLCASASWSNTPCRADSTQDGGTNAPSASIVIGTTSSKQTVIQATDQN